MGKKSVVFFIKNLSVKKFARNLICAVLLVLASGQYGIAQDEAILASKAYVDSMINSISTGGGNGIGLSVSGIKVATSQIRDAVTNDQFYVDMDGFRFRAFKATQTNYWGARIVNNTGQSVIFGVRAHHIYNGTQTIASQGELTVGEELNPDAENGDLGYSTADVFVVYFFDTTNMHFYRWTIQVAITTAVMIVERLH
ncbi:MAG: hypothetical protein LBR41_02420 [Rickettsiales bacterium]|jgi:hypothetical protein|nr:hypothetical protein [Rickettsiales bacterium]